jgi:hypothetical protein
MGHAQGKPALDLGKLLAALVAEAEAIDLPEFAARISATVRPPAIRPRGGISYCCKSGGGSSALPDFRIME